MALVFLYGNVEKRVHFLWLKTIFRVFRMFRKKYMKIKGSQGPSGLEILLFLWQYTCVIHYPNQGINIIERYYR